MLFRSEAPASKPGSFGSTRDAADPKARAGSSKDGPDAGSRSDSMEQAAERISNVKLEGDGSPFGEKLQPGKPKAVAGPSLLSQQAPAHKQARQGAAAANPPPYTEGDPPPSDGPTAPVSSSAMSVDAQLPLLDGTEKITVKIADLGNGGSSVCAVALCRAREADLAR